MALHSGLRLTRCSLWFGVNLNVSNMFNIFFFLPETKRFCFFPPCLNVTDGWLITLLVLSTHSSFSSCLPKSSGNGDLFYNKVLFRISHVLIFFFKIPVNVSFLLFYPLIGSISLKSHLLKRCLNHCQDQSWQIKGICNFWLSMTVVHVSFKTVPDDLTCFNAITVSMPKTNTKMTIPH